MEKSRTAVIVLILVGLLCVPAQAQVIPGRWEKVQTLPLGPQITVELKSGDRLKGQFEELSPSELLLRTGSTQAGIPRADIERISTREADSLVNGAIIGAGVVVGFVLVGHAIAEGGSVTLSSVAYTAIWAAITAASGVGLDALKKTEVVLYQAR